MPSTTVVGLAHDATHLSLVADDAALTVPLDPAGDAELTSWLRERRPRTLHVLDADPEALRRGVPRSAGALVDHVDLTPLVERLDARLPDRSDERARVAYDLARLVRTFPTDAGERDAGRLPVQRFDGIGPALIGSELCRLTGVGAVELHEATRQRRVLGVQVSAVRWVYPRAQFRDPERPAGIAPADLVPDLAATLQRLAGLGLTPLEQARWLRRR
ncbi:hypothetical protein RDV89_08010 [Nocardioides zeae]|uniref:Uncharacterized protein n=1 Tax=Nocardioides imazamoxiresistens TaxID=3231893 RepID=A0ABU3PUU2_9ACTN|nr:hypothetical protein [Nocardioides zeae]MDT9593008.1 hypothetical protein [Nocardioides zeae]